MILVDSSVWIDYFNGRPTWQTELLDEYLSGVPVVMGDLILTHDRGPDAVARRPRF